MAANSTGPTVRPTRWYQKTLWIIVLLLLLPPVGAFLAWRYRPDWPKAIRIGLAIWGALWALHELNRMLAPAGPATTQAIPTSAPVARTVAPPLPTLPRPTAAINKLTVTGAGAEGVTMRNAPGTGDRLKLLSDGAELVALGEEQQAAGRTWKRVKDGDGTEGWIAAEFVRSTAGAVAPTATRPIGATLTPIPGSTPAPKDLQKVPR